MIVDDDHDFPIASSYASMMGLSIDGEAWRLDWPMDVAGGNHERQVNRRGIATFAFI